MTAFAQQTSGPATSTGQNTNIGALVQDRANNVVETVGVGGIAQALRSPLGSTAGNIGVLGPQTALTAITTAQTLASFALGAQLLNKLNRALEIEGELIYSTTSGNVATLTLALALGAVSLCSITTAATNTAASTNLPVRFKFTLQTTKTGTSGTLEVHGRVDANIGTAAAAAIASYLDTNTAASSAANLNIAETLTLTIAASAAVPSAQLRQLVAEVVN